MEIKPTPEELDMGKDTSRYRIINDKNEIVEANIYEWAKFFEQEEKRQVSVTTISNAIFVSTVFTGLVGFDSPQLFETMVFEFGKDKEGAYKWDTYMEAFNGHQEIVDRLEAEEKEELPVIN